MQQEKQLTYATLLVLDALACAPIAADVLTTLEVVGAEAGCADERDEVHALTARGSTGRKRRWTVCVAAPDQDTRTVQK